MKLLIITQNFYTTTY